MAREFVDESLHCWQQLHLGYKVPFQMWDAEVEQHRFAADGSALLLVAGPHLAALQKADEL